jgi:hypothetical protein
MIVSIATAVFAELPIAALLGLISIRLLRINTSVARRAEPTAMLQPLWRTPLVVSTAVLAPQGSSQSSIGGTLVLRGTGPGCLKPMPAEDWPHSKRTGCVETAAGRGRQNGNRSREQKVHGVDENEHCHD